MSSLGRTAAALDELPRTFVCAPAASEFEALLLAEPEARRARASEPWLAEVAVLLGLIATALLFWPGFLGVEASAPAAYDRAALAQFRELAIGAAESAGGGDRRALSAAVPLASVPARPRLEPSTVTRPGESLSAALVRLGVGPGDAARVSDLVPARRIEPGTKVDVILGSRVGAGATRPLERLVLRPRFDLEVAIARRADAFAVTAGAVAVDATPLRYRGTIGGNFAQSAAAAGLSADVVQQYLRAVDKAGIAGDLRPDDTYDLVVEHRRAANGPSESGNLLVARLDRRGTTVAKLLRWGAGGQLVSALDRAPAVVPGGSPWPVEGPITSPFGLRFHPILGYLRMHSGVDIAAVWGTPIRALSDGIVGFAGWHGGHGEYVRLEHGSGLASGYGHMSRIAVAPGVHVRRGETIGYVGASGLATGSHLHLEVFRDGRAVDPLSWLEGGGLAGAQRSDAAAIATRIARLEALVPVGVAAR